MFIFGIYLFYIDLSNCYGLQYSIDQQMLIDHCRGALWLEKQTERKQCLIAGSLHPDQETKLALMK